MKIPKFISYNINIILEKNVFEIPFPRSAQVNGIHRENWGWENIETLFTYREERIGEIIEQLSTHKGFL